MPDADLSHIALLAGRLADASGRVIRQHFRTPVTVDYKADLSPVTIADRDAEKAIRDILADERPDDGIIGEEFGKSSEASEFVWVIDPIDGTKSFIAGRPIFGTLIALVQNSSPVLGVIDQPVNRERWIGVHGAGTKLNGRPVSVGECKTIADATVATTSPDLFDTSEKLLWQDIASKAKQAVYGGDCYSYALLASGFIDMVVETGLQKYDYCALAPVVEEAGGVISDWQGNPLTIESDGSVLACGDERLHAEVLKILTGV
ncbi:MAG: histidinol-phosphatase [Rhodospirillaceae bacterium]|nr:histidinol-phosphatase [Rhodospirillaceae bacterium]